MSDKVKLTIDGKEVEVEKGTTVLQAARQASIDIPTLCFLKEINAAGDCKMCIVDVEGRRGFVPSFLLHILYVLLQIFLQVFVVRNFHFLHMLNNLYYVLIILNLT